MNLFGVLYIQDWLILICILAGFLYIYSTRTIGYLEKNGVATETPIPIFGNMWKLMSQPLHLVDMANYRVLGKVHGFYEGSVPTLVIGDIELIQAILVKNFNHFIDRRKCTVGHRLKVMNKFLTAMPGEEWKIARHIVTPAFSTTKLLQIEHHMEECAQNLLKKLREEITPGVGKDIDVNSRLSSYIMNVIASTAFGMQSGCSTNDAFCYHAMKIANQDTSMKLILKALAPTWVFSLLDVDLFPPSSISYLCDIAEKVIEKRIATNSKSHDFLQLLIDAKIDEKDVNISEYGSSFEDHFNLDSYPNQTPSINYSNCKKVLAHETIAAQTVLFILEGLNTISTTISLALYHLALNPDWQNKLQAEIDAARSKNNGNIRNEQIYQMSNLNMIISEVLRLHPPVTRLERICTNDCTLGTIKVKKGMIVAIPIYAIHHDEEHFSDPEIFNPHRFYLENKSHIQPYTYLPFGAGPRNCIGNRFALMQIKIALVKILEEFRVSKCEMTQVSVPMRTANGILVPKLGLVLKLSQRSSISVHEQKE